MRRLLRWSLFLGVPAILLFAGYSLLHAYWKNHSNPGFRESPVTRGEIISVVNSTGTIQPVLSVQIGSFVSGPIIESHVDYNSKVHKGDLLARIDPRIYEANVARDAASLAHAKADVERVDALLEQATNDEERSNNLRETNKDFISDTEMDQFRFARSSLAAQLSLAKAAVKQAEATLKLSQANLDYTEIVSPVDGIVIDRKVDPGQTVAAQFQTPVLYIVAPEMEERMFVYASVDEADMGLIRAAQDRKKPVLFTVDAHPDDLFQGQISQVRLNPTTVQNVVTYTVVVEAPQVDLKLLPGMTASLSFQIERHADILKIPNAALRFYPKPELVRPEDQKLLDGVEESPDQPDTSEARRSAMEKAEAAKNRSQRHVWVAEGDLLRAIEITTGLSDNQNTELVAGPLKEGDQLVTGVRPPTWRQ